MLAIVIVIITNSMDMNLRKLWKIVEDRGAYGSQIPKHDLVTEQQQCYFCRKEIFVVIAWRELALPLPLLSAVFASGSVQTGTLKMPPKYIFLSLP